MVHKIGKSVWLSAIHLNGNTHKQETSAKLDTPFKIGLNYKYMDYISTSGIKPSFISDPKPHKVL